MRDIILSLLLSILLIAPFCLTPPAIAQTKEPLPPPQPAKDYFPEKWEEYTSEEGRFRIRFPGKPKEEFSPAGVHFLSYSGVLEYRVSYVDEPELTDDPDSAQRYLQEMRAASLAIARIANERIIKEKEVTINGYPGSFTYVESSKGWVRDQQIVVGRRVYAIIVEGRKGRANELEEKNNFERVATAFINSFKLIPSSAKPNDGNAD